MTFFYDYVIPAVVAIGVSIAIGILLFTTIAEPLVSMAYNR